MADETRFEGLRKLSGRTAGELISGSRMPFQTVIESPRDSDVATVLAEFERKGADQDMLALFALALPPREAAWWACLAGRDLYPADDTDRSPTLDAAEAWVFRPTDENRAAVKTALERARPDDEGIECANAALYAPGTLGPGDLEKYDAPKDVREIQVFAMMVKSCAAAQDPEARRRLLVERALDIARGGNGRVDPPAPDPARA